MKKKQKLKKNKKYMEIIIISLFNFDIKKC